MKSKYLALGLSALLVFSLVSCGGQQAQEPQEPTQEIQQAEPISTQPVIAPEEVKQEIVTTASETEPEELSGDALIDFFKLAYDISKPYTDTLSTKEAIAFELYALDVKAEVDNKGLPADYADQYRAWRPVEEAPPAASTTQQVSEATQNQDQGSNQQQQQNQSQPQQNQSVTQQIKPSTQTQSTTPQSSGGKAMYGGFNTYDEYIQDLHRQFPEYSIERIKELNPDQATGGVNDAAEWDAQAGLLNGG